MRNPVHGVVASGSFGCLLHRHTFLVTSWGTRPRSSMARGRRSHWQLARGVFPAPEGSDLHSFFPPSQCFQHVHNTSKRRITIVMFSTLAFSDAWLGRAQVGGANTPKPAYLLTWGYGGSMSMTIGSEAPPAVGVELAVASCDTPVTPSNPLPLSTANSGRGATGAGGGRDARGLPPLSSVVLSLAALSQCHTSSHKSRSLKVFGWVWLSCGGW